MKILLANHRYFASSGPERYMFNLIDALERRRHQIIPFSVRYSKNSPSRYEEYFVSPPAEADQIYFRDQKFSPLAVLKTLSRLFYAKDVEKAVQRLINDTHPDIAYVLIYLRKLSPSLLVGLKNAGLPIMVRLSEFGMLCPGSICYRDGHPCQMCVKGNLIPSVWYRCVQDSLPVSLINAIATHYHHFRHYFDLIDCFVTPTQFMYQMMLSAGYPAEKLSWIRTFVDTDFFHPGLQTEIRGSPYFLYVGRVDFDKGVHILLDAWQRLKKSCPGQPIQLKIAGTNAFGSPEYMEKLMSLGLQDVTFLGEIHKNEVAGLMRNAYMTILPSIWFENLPNALLESYASGTSVIASNLGSLKECVAHNETGLLFEAGNSDDLMQKMKFALEYPDQVTSMSQTARDLVLSRYSREMHLSSLESLFERLVKK